MRSWLTMTLMGLLIATGGAGCAPHPSPYAIIVRSMEPGPDVSEVLRISDPAAVGRLESHFPGYKARPAGLMWGGGAWVAGYDVYIDDSSGRTYHITVGYSYDDEEPTYRQRWSVPHGQVDHAVAGDFEKFVEELEVKRARERPAPTTAPATKPAS
jgi:hypothetical protein